jgi:1-deoxy-D-xylulose-5-phosphate reductoisomerase
MKRIAILGSTGSIGINALEVIRQSPEEFSVVALSTNTNIDILYKQITEFKPLFVCVRDIKRANKLKQKLSKRIRIFIGEDGLLEMLKDERIEKVLLAISGSGALSPLLKAIEYGKQIALANKEALVMAGMLIMREAAKRKIKIIPVDSEQSAIWQCLEGEERLKLEKIYLTASGGPFRKLNQKDLKGVSISRVLRHPRWRMGPKVSVDSANLMNKGLELLETMFLFDIPCNRIKILIHPEAIIHSMVEFIDGAILAQLSATDMRIPIQYALFYPERISNHFPRINFHKLKGLHFQAPDFNKFPCLKLAYRVASELGTSPAILNAANEVCVEEFLKQRLDFVLIPRIIAKVLDRHKNILSPDLNDILEADSWARSETYRIAGRLN